MSIPSSNAASDLDSMGRVHNHSSIPGYNGPWWPSGRLERGWFYSPQAHKQEDVVEQEHVPAGMQELCSQQGGDTQKPGAQGESPQMSMAKSCLGCMPGASCRTMEGILSHSGGQGSQVPGGAAGCIAGSCRLPEHSLFSPAAVVSGNLVLLELQPAPEPSPEPEDDGKDLQQGQPQAAWKEGTLGSPASAPEPSVAQSPRGEQFIPGQPSAGSQVQNGGSCCCPPCPGLAVCG